MTSQYINIARVLDAVKDQGLSKMAALAHRRDLLFDEIANLRKEMENVSKYMTNCRDSRSWMSGDAHASWLQSQIGDKMRAVAQLLVELEQQKYASAKAVGRRDAFDKILTSIPSQKED